MFIYLFIFACVCVCVFSNGHYEIKANDPSTTCSYKELLQRKLEIKTCLTCTRKYEGKIVSLFFSSYLLMRPRAPRPNGQHPLTSVERPFNLRSDFVTYDVTLAFVVYIYLNRCPNQQLFKNFGGNNRKLSIR